MNFGRKSRRDDVNLELTPLIDVMFLLLIFLLVTATFSRDQNSALPVDLPTGVSGEQLPSDAKITLVIHEDETVSLSLPEQSSDERIPTDELRDRLNTLPDDWRRVPLHLRGDTDVRYGRVMDVLDMSRQLGFERVFNVVKTGRPQGE
jgi:biopolymer transport protein ExbD